MKKRKERRNQLTPFGLAVKKRLLEKGMTQGELAEKVGIHGSYLTDILYGNRAGWKYKEQIQELLSLKKSS